ncbi:hypothetical protein ERJ75_000029600 [Trypanosoma vivax]|nr:hypothetical protein ERJ75_000029600 [Trypanosoma vivax]
MVRSEATEAAAIRAAIDAARRDVEELARDEKHERYTIHEDEREARRHILQRRSCGVHQQLGWLQLPMDTAVAEFTAGAAWDRARGADGGARHLRRRSASSSRLLHSRAHSRSSARTARACSGTWRQ